jgi:hypothetical protein
VAERILEAEVLQVFSLELVLMNPKFSKFQA